MLNTIGKLLREKIGLKVNKRIARVKKSSENIAVSNIDITGSGDKEKNNLYFLGGK